MCIHWAITYDCGCEYLSVTECLVGLCPGFELIRSSRSGDCATCIQKQHGITETPNRESSSVHDDSVITSPTTYSVKVVNPWLPPEQTERPWSGLTRRKADYAWQREHYIRMLEYQCSNTKSSPSDGPNSFDSASSAGRIPFSFTRTRSRDSGYSSLGSKYSSRRHSRLGDTSLSNSRSSTAQTSLASSKPTKHAHSQVEGTSALSKCHGTTGGSPVPASDSFKISPSLNKSTLVTTEKASKTQDNKSTSDSTTLKQEAGVAPDSFLCRPPTASIPTTCVDCGCIGVTDPTDVSREAEVNFSSWQPPISTLHMPSLPLSQTNEVNDLVDTDSFIDFNSLSAGHQMELTSDSLKLLPTPETGYQVEAWQDCGTSTEKSPHLERNIQQNCVEKNSDLMSTMPFAGDARATELSEAAYSDLHTALVLLPSPNWIDQTGEQETRTLSHGQPETLSAGKVFEKSVPSTKPPILPYKYDLDKTEHSSKHRPDAATGLKPPLVLIQPQSPSESAHSETKEGATKESLQEACRQNESDFGLNRRLDSWRSLLTLSEGELSFIGMCVGSNSFESSLPLPFTSDAGKFLKDLVSQILRRSLQCTDNRRQMTSGGSERTSSRASTSSSRVGSGTTSATSVRLQTQYSEGDKEDPNNDEGARRSPTLKRKLDDGDPSTKLFACPYAKFEPAKYSRENLTEPEYWSCGSCCLRTISRLKQHLYRVHSRPTYYCDRCFQPFKVREELAQHARQDLPCELERGAPRYKDRMTDSQFEAIKRRVMRGDPCDVWYNIYSVLFPDAPKPLSPYMTTADATTVNHFVTLFRWFGPEEMMNMLRQRQNDGSAPLEVPTQVVVDEAFEIALAEFLRHSPVSQPVLSVPSATAQEQTTEQGDEDVLTMAPMVQRPRSRGLLPGQHDVSLPPISHPTNNQFGQTMDFVDTRDPSNPPLFMAHAETTHDWNIPTTIFEPDQVHDAFNQYSGPDVELSLPGLNYWDYEGTHDRHGTMSGVSCSRLLDDGGCGSACCWAHDGVD